MKILSPFQKALFVGQTVYLNDPTAGLSLDEYRVVEIKTPSGTVESVDSIVVVENEDGHIAEVHPGELAESTSITGVLNLRVDYALNGEDAKVILDNLERLVTRAIGDGILTGGSSAEVETYSVDVSQELAVPTEEELADFFLTKIDSGEWQIEDLVTRMARFGLMERVAFVNEMRERMDQQEQA